MAKFGFNPSVQIGTGIARPDNPDVAFAPIYCAEHFFSGPWPCSCTPGPQWQVLTSAADEISTGGSRGGTKTSTILACMIKGNLGLKKFKPGDVLNGVDATYVAHPNYRGLLLAERDNDLGYLLDRAEEMYKGVGLTEVTRGSPSEARFPSGAKILFGYYGDDGWKKFLGPEFQRIGFEQIEKMESRETHDRIIGSLRSRWPEMVTQAFNNWNPGGGDDLRGAPGQSWVMEYFRVEDYISGRIPPSAPIRDEHGKTTVFIPSKVTDNPFYRWKFTNINTPKGKKMVPVLSWRCKLCGVSTESHEKPSSCSNPRCVCYQKV